MFTFAHPCCVYFLFSVSEETTGHAGFHAPPPASASLTTTRRVLAISGTCLIRPNSMCTQALIIASNASMVKQIGIRLNLAAAAFLKLAAAPAVSARCFCAPHRRAWSVRACAFSFEFQEFSARGCCARAPVAVRGEGYTGRFHKSRPAPAEMAQKNSKIPTSPKIPLTPIS